MTHYFRLLSISLLLMGLAVPASLPGQDQPADCDPDNCEVVLMDIESRTDWTTNCDLVTIPAPAPGGPDMRQICDPTYLILRDPTCGPEGTDSNFLELTDDEYCFDELLPCNAVGFRTFCMEASLAGEYEITNVGASAGDLVFNLAGCTKIYRSDDLFNPLCQLEEGGELIGVTLPAPSEGNPMPTIGGKFDTLSVTCALEGAEAAALFADACEDPGNFCFDAFSDGFIEITLSTGNLIAETMVSGSTKICTSYATFGFEVLTDLIEPNCHTCDEESSPNGVIPVSFILPDDGDDAVLSDYEDPSNYLIVIDDQNDGDNEWDHSITPTGSGTYEFTEVADSDYTVAIIYVPLAGDKKSGDPEACGFCVREATVGLIPEPEVNAEITDDCISSGDPGAPVVGTGVIDLTVTGAENIGYLWDNEATTSRIENLEADQYCVTITYGPPSSALDPTGRCSICLCFEVNSFNLTCDISGDALICAGEPTTLTAAPEGGSGNYSYSWSTGETTESITVDPMATTIYEVTITDEDFAGDCFAVCSKEVGVFNPTCEITGDKEIWLGASATLTAQIPGEGGNFEFQWSTGDLTPTITVYPIEPTTYDVTITEFDDAGNRGCSYVCSETVWVIEPSCEIEGDHILCRGQSAELIVIPPPKNRNYKFEWSNGSTANWTSVYPKETTTYSVTVTDISKEGEILCSFVCEHEIAVIEPECKITGDPQICEGESTILTAEVVGGTGSYSYRWSNDKTGKSVTVSPSSTTTYEVVVSDIGAGSSSDCSFTCNFEVEVINLGCAVNGDTRICNGESTTLTANGSGGTGSYQYQWSNGATTQSITVSPSSDWTYRVTVTDIDGDGNPVCATVCEKEVEVSNPSCSIIDKTEVACGEKGNITFIAEGGIPPYEFVVFDPSGNAVESGVIYQDGKLTRIDGLMTGAYTVSIQDDEGCETDCSATISEINGSGDFTGCLACNDKINVTLDQDCAVEVTLDMVAEGNITDCDKHESVLQALEVVVFDGEYPVIGGQPRPDNVVDKCGLFNYSILLKKEYEGCFSWTQCWGQINAEDNTPDVEIKPAKVRGIYKYKDHYGNAQFTPYDCGSSEFAALFEDPYGYLQDDCSSFELHYLVCEDLDKIYQEPRSYNDPDYPYFVGNPLTGDDCCGTLELIGVEDWLEELPCEGRYSQNIATIKRTFTYKNKQGMTATAVQEICFYRPRVFLPDCMLHVDICDFESAGGANELLRPDNLSSLVREGEESIPFYYNGIAGKTYLTGQTCDLTVSFQDQEFPAACGKKIVRTWSFLDWCWNENTRRSRYGFAGPEDCYNGFYETPDGYSYPGEQTMKFEQQIVMEAAPEMTIECRDIHATTGPFNCTAVVAPPAPEISDCIAADFEFEVWGYVADPKTGLEHYELIGHSLDGKLAGVPVGTYDLFYRIEDDCGRIYRGVWKNDYGEWEYDWDRACVLNVTDDIEPVAVCDDDLHVSIGGPGTSTQGIAKVTAADIDEGSWDNCGPVEVKVRRAIDPACLEIYADRIHHLSWPSEYVARFDNGAIVYLAGRDVPDLDIKKGEPLIAQELGGHFFSWWSEAAFFTCCDISADDKDKRRLELRVTDRAGNSNICWLDILIEDKIPPRCQVAEPLVSISCLELDFDPNDPAQVAATFGGPEEMLAEADNCTNFTYSETQSFQPGECGTGILTRHFTVQNGSGMTANCAQTITIKEVNDYTIKFPGDLESSTCGLEPASPQLIAESQACDILAVNIDTTRFEASGGECFKQMLTYRVINWCEYDGVGLDPTIIPRDVDDDDDLSEGTLLEATYETGIREKYPVCTSSEVYIPDEAFIVKVFDANADGAKKGDFPVKILFRDDCYNNEEELLSHVGPLVLRLSSEDKGGYYGVGPCYKPYCPAGEQAPTSAEAYAAHVEDLCRNLIYGGQCWTPGYYEYTQMVKVYDNEAPSLTVMGAQTFCTYGNPDNEAAFPCGGSATLTFRLEDACTPGDTEARNVRLLMNGDPAEAMTIASGLFTVANLDPASNMYTISAPSLPVGQHTFVLNAVDGCGNVEGARFEFEIKDCKTPAPICINTLSVDLMPTEDDDEVGMNTVWATDFIASPVRDCTPHEDPDVLANGPNDVKYYVFSERYLDELGSGPGDITIENFTEKYTSVVFTCEDMPSQPVYIYALDGAGNFDYCTALAVIAPGNDVVCGDRDDNTEDESNIAGLVTNEGMTPIAGVDVQLSGQASMRYETDDAGNYRFDGLITGYDYTVTPTLDKDPLNGVSTFDLVLTSKHILGVRPLDSPYKLIAADVNNSGSITTLDLIQLRKLILSIDMQFSNNTSWRFIDAGYQFPDPGNPWLEHFPEVKSINNLEGSAEGDFIAVKIGDVNGSARANALQIAEARDVAGAFYLEVEEQSLQPGKTYIVDVDSRQLADIQGFQMTLNLARHAVELVDILYGAAAEEHFGIFAEQGLITTSWNTSDFRLPTSHFRFPTSNLPLFSLVLKARSAAKLSEVLSISSRLTRAEAYSTSDELLDVALNFSHETIAGAGFELHQNQPNPFRETTLIGFSLPEAAAATITLRDVNGRAIKTIQGNFDGGYNEVFLNNADLPSGILYYTLKTDRHTLTRKMIHFE